MKVLNFGSCNIDYVYKVEHMVRPGETVSAQTMTVFSGGKGLNQSLALARSGAPVYHAGCIGKEGLFLKDTLANAGVDVQNIRVGQTPTGHAIIQLDRNGENSILLYRGANHAVTKEQVDAVLQGFSKQDILVLQNEISNLEYIVCKAYEKGMQIVWNPSPINEAVFQIDLAKIHTLVANQIEVCELSKTEDPEQACRFFKTRYPQTNLVLTLGKQGCVFANATQQLYCPAYPVTTVDTTAAGDTFLGYFVANYFKTKDILACLQIASMAAALAVTKNGAAESIPYQNEVEAALRQIK